MYGFFPPLGGRLRKAANRIDTANALNPNPKPKPSEASWGGGRDVSSDHVYKYTQESAFISSSSPVSDMNSS
jgi:hypothetical protein